MCGQNIQRFVTEAANRNIDLSNSSVLRIDGNGFLNVSGFYTREKPNDWKMVGYFHYVFVADGYVFDFDLAEPIVVKLDDYIRLQFSPPTDPFVIFGITYGLQNEVGSWDVTQYTWQSIYKNAPVASNKYKFGQIVDLKKISRMKRLR